MNNISVVMVSGGYNGNDLTSVELLFLNGTRLCALPDLPVARYYHSQSGPLACGGGRGDSERASCVTFSGGTWEQTHTLGQRRYSHTAWASPQGVLLMGSRYDSGTTTELLNDDGSTTASFNLDNNRR